MDINSYDYFNAGAQAQSVTDIIRVGEQTSSIQSLFMIARTAIQAPNDPLSQRRWLSFAYGQSYGDSNLSRNSIQIEVNGNLFPESPIEFTRSRTEMLYYHFSDAMRALKAVANQPSNVFFDRMAAYRCYSPNTPNAVALTNTSASGVVQGASYRTGLIDSFVFGMRFDAFKTSESNIILSGPDTKSAGGSLLITLKRDGYHNFQFKKSALDDDLYNDPIKDTDNINYDIFIVARNRVVFTPVVSIF